jgi:hypothetical protein
MMRMKSQRGALRFVAATGLAGLSAALWNCSTGTTASVGVTDGGPSDGLSGEHGGDTGDKGETAVGDDSSGDMSDGTAIASDATSSGSADGGSDTEEDGASAEGMDDPCPTGKIAVNCSNTCSQGTFGCGETACSGSTSFTVTRSSTFPVVLRTPANPTSSEYCTLSGSCAHGTTYGMRVDVSSTLGALEGLKITVGGPWEIIAEGSVPTSPGCVTCLSTLFETFSFYVVTTDRSAPARNVVIEELGDGGAWDAGILASACP